MESKWYLSAAWIAAPTWVSWPTTNSFSVPKEKLFFTATCTAEYNRHADRWQNINTS